MGKIKTKEKVFCINVLCYICGYIDLGPELQCLLKVKGDLSKVLIFQDEKNNVSN